MRIPISTPDWRLALLALLALAITPLGAFAQARPVAPAKAAQPALPETTAITRVESWTDPNMATLMLVDDIGPDARAIVIRRPGNLPNNIILVTRSTTPKDLATAVSSLITSRANRGDVVDREMRALIGAKPQSAKPGSKRGAASATTPRADTGDSPSVRLAAADLQRLRSAPEFSIPGIGHGPALVIRMKAKAGSAKN
jgi:hypothetical protein